MRVPDTRANRLTAWFLRGGMRSAGLLGAAGALAAFPHSALLQAVRGGA